MLSYYYRLLYGVVHEPNSQYKKIKKNVSNFEYGETRLYGRILPFTHVPVILKEANLRAPKKQEATNLIRVASFVADAFDDFVGAFETAQFKNQISMDGGWLTDPVPKAGYTSPTQEYKAYRAASYEVFIKYLDDNDLNSKIRDFETFYIQFYNFHITLHSLYREDFFIGACRIRSINKR